MTIQNLWDMVNGAETMQDVTRAYAEIKNADLSFDDFDELMMAASYIERELHN